MSSFFMIFNFFFIGTLVVNSKTPDSRLNLSEVACHDEPSEIYLGSPSIIRLFSNHLLASHDFFGHGYGKSARNVPIYFSKNNGESWSFLSYIQHSYWTTLAVYSEKIYAIGVYNDINRNVIIHRSIDQGKTWIYQGNDNGIILFNGSFATGAIPIVTAIEILYRTIEYFPSPSRWSTDFQAAVISCHLFRMINDNDDPIMNPQNWKITPPFPFNSQWIPKSFPTIVSPGFLEGNIVIIPKQSSNEEIRVLNMLRFNSIPLANLAII